MLELIKAVSDTVLDMINAVYRDKSLIMSNTVSEIALINSDVFSN